MHVYKFPRFTPNIFFLSFLLTGRREFYRYSPKETPAMKTFPIPGIHVVVSIIFQNRTRFIYLTVVWLIAGIALNYWISLPNPIHFHSIPAIGVKRKSIDPLERDTRDIRKVFVWSISWLSVISHDDCVWWHGSCRYVMHVISF